MKIETGQDMRRARDQMGLSAYELADLLRLGADSTAGGQKVREMERGARRLTGPLCIAVEALLSGWRPE